MATLRNRVEALENKLGINIIHVVHLYKGETDDEALALQNSPGGSLGNWHGALQSEGSLLRGRLSFQPFVPKRCPLVRTCNGYQSIAYCLSKRVHKCVFMHRLEY